MKGRRAWLGLVLGGVACWPLQALGGPTLAAAPGEQKPAEDPRLAPALAKLDVALAKGTSAERIEAIQAAADLPGAAVAKAIAKGLEDQERAVVEAAIEALRFHPDPAALAAMHACLAREPRMKDDAELAAKLIRGIAQRGDKSSIKALTEDPFRTLGPATTARILGLGRIRTPESVEALMGLMRKVGPLRSRPAMGEFRLALAVLTGVDMGESQEAWTAWWNDNKQSVRVSIDPPQIAKPLQMRWNAYWGLETVRERPREREERGKRDGDRSSPPDAGGAAGG